ncbi:BQ2448_6153 [Microbotryum intermedium]|uniref:BQ2448_6153 protein n=1 Tax=Microbotryum intermedium TaxID=269621 RepID=A0A238FNZ3_9BASI|nr:BQ2448_6153 [Microbotryum intermedium]
MPSSFDIRLVPDVAFEIRVGSADSSNAVHVRPVRFSPGSSTTTSATSAQVYTRLYETLVKKWSVRARSIAASSPRAKFAQCLPTIETEHSPTRKRCQMEDTVEADSTASENSLVKKMRLGDEDENVNPIKEEKEEIVVDGPESQPRAELQERPCSAPPSLPFHMTRSSLRTRLGISGDSESSSRRFISPLAKSGNPVPGPAASPLVLCRRIIASRCPSAKSTRHQPVVDISRHCTCIRPCRSGALLGVLESFELVLETRAQGWRLLALEVDKIELHKRRTVK